MNSVACPGCGLPREAGLLGVVPCPICGNNGEEPPRPSEPEPEQKQEVVAGTPLAPTPRKSLLPLRFVAGVGVGVLGVLGWQAFQAARESVQGVAVAAGEKQTDTRTLFTKPKEPGTTHPPLVRTIEVAPPPRAYIAVAPPPHTPFRGPPPRVTTVDLPNTNYFTEVPPGASVTLKGRVKTLRVPALERGAVLDVSELEAQEIIVSGKIDGGSTLRVRTAKGRVTFQAKVDGRSTVEVLAPEGTVTFFVPTTRDNAGSRIAGGSIVRVTAKTTSFYGQISGADTQVMVTVTRGGSLGFAELDGPSRLEYRKASPTDPDPSLSEGRVGAAAVVKRVE